MAIKTLDDLIGYTDTFDRRNTTYYRQVGNIVVPATNALTLYWNTDLIQESILTLYTTEEQRVKYSFKPYHLSTDIYTVPSLGWLIMKMNNCENPSKFKVRSKIKIIAPDALNNILVTIISKCSEKLDKNLAEYTSDLDFVYPYSDR